MKGDEKVGLWVAAAMLALLCGLGVWVRGLEGTPTLPQFCGTAQSCTK